MYVCVWNERNKHGRRQRREKKPVCHWSKSFLCKSKLDWMDVEWNDLERFSDRQKKFCERHSNGTSTTLYYITRESGEFHCQKISSTLKKESPNVVPP